VVGIEIGDVPADAVVRRTLADWSLAEWADDFPDDTIEWYLDLYEESSRDDRLPVCLAAFMNDRVVGTASLIADDELPDALEPGPWVAAVFVELSSRGQGVGASLVAEAARRGHALGFSEVFLYTESGAEWYARMGWQRVRVARLARHPVTVMVHRDDTGGVGVTTT
jgi:GNAT superfamily N-acetyltransferase